MNLSRQILRRKMIFCLVCVFTLVVAAFITGGYAQNGGSNPKSTIDTKPKNPLLGRWKSDEAVIEFRADGTITINDTEYVYKVKNAVITVSSDEGSMMFPYSLEGDTLTVEVEGREVVYERVKGKSGSGLGPGTGVGSGAGAGSREGVLPQLVGKWCYVRNLTGTNSMASSRCFVLNGNGTYEYSGESSSSGTYGSTAGQSYDSGRWTATRTTLTAYSNSRGKTTYPIVLRNHPKTGDPMIVVDGDAYVTYYQKNPW